MSGEEAGERSALLRVEEKSECSCVRRPVQEGVKEFRGELRVVGGRVAGGGYARWSECLEGLEREL